jgi:7-cyano-7-deazaguanine synthase in queuosine biosynthesis
MPSGYRAEITESAVRRGEDACVLLFSGGRDSTVAAVRLGAEFRRLALVTVSTGHLVGLQQVTRRLIELRTHLPEHTQWVHAVVTPEATTLDGIYVDSCLPCHHTYFGTAMWVANRVNAKFIATNVYALWKSTDTFLN